MEKYLVEELHKVGKKMLFLWSSRPEWQKIVVLLCCSCWRKEFEIPLIWVGFFVVVVNPGICSIDLWLCSYNSSTVFYDSLFLLVPVKQKLKYCLCASRDSKEHALLWFLCTSFLPRLYLIITYPAIEQ